MYLDRLCVLETMCFDYEAGPWDFRDKSAQGRDPSELSRKFYNAAVDEYNRLMGASGVVFATAPTKDNAFAQSKLEILQKWIDEGRDLTGLNVDAWEL